MKTFRVQVTQVVEVTLDETKFTEQFMEQFRNGFYPFFDIETHAKHLAQIEARGLINGFNPDEFIEGYGPMSDMGIKFNNVGKEQEEEIIE